MRNLRAHGESGVWASRLLRKENLEHAAILGPAAYFVLNGRNVCYLLDILPFAYDSESQRIAEVAKLPFYAIVYWPRRRIQSYPCALLKLK
ncbi:MAG: hypothetical protein ABSH49_15770 [Bryobacteraceae bacterium]|jgi:hypothetical protein